MIVTCEQCQTRFKLDASRIPDSGARVRCSRCKHAFFVVKAGAGSRDAAVHALASEAAEAPVAAPAPAQDLSSLGGAALTDNTSATRLMPPVPAAPAAAPRDARDDELHAGSEDESDWQFNEPVRDDGRPATPREPRRPAARRAPKPQEEGVSLDALGSPDSWDILGDASLPPLESVVPNASSRASETAPRASDASRSGAAAAARTEGASQAAPIAAPAASAERTGLRAAPRDLAFFAGVWLWIAAVAALALAPRSNAGRVETSAPTLSGVALDGLRGRFLENAVAGPVFVVTAELRASGGAATPGRLEVVVLGDDGEVARASLGDAPDETMLRETAPEALEHEIAASGLARGSRTIREGERLKVAALLRGAPRDLTGFRVEQTEAAAPAR